MIDYNKFKTENFVTDTSFRRWVSGDSPEHTAFWEFWLEAHPEKAEMIAQAKLLVLALKNQPTAISDDEIALEVERIVKIVESTQPNKVRWMFPVWARVAATVILVSGLGWMFWPRSQTDLLKNTTTETNPTTAATKNKQVEVSNNTESDYTTTLPDGTTVQLKKGSKVSFLEKFGGDKREVYLTGEAFFNVVRNPNQPFFVYANGLVMRVLGTSFTVKAYSKDPKVVVAVKTGKVMVFPLSELKKSRTIANYQVQSLYLTPNQQATFERQAEKLNKALVEKPAVITQPLETPDFTFENTPIQEVFAKLKKAYGLDIIYDAEVMKNCSVTAPLGNESLFVKLDIICKTIGARYEIVETEIVVSGRGCQ
jgi:ferric-dicitrate binding protein FerR (iron transport regulator)